MTPSRCIAAALIAAATLSTQAAPKEWTVTQLPDVGAWGSWARGINNRGEIAGTTSFEDTRPHPAAWSRDGAGTDLAAGNPATGVANAINYAGTIAGNLGHQIHTWTDGVATHGINHMVTWDTNGGLLHDYGPRLSGAAINDRGAIVGTQLDTGRPFLLEDGVYTWLLELRAMREQGWQSFAPMDINDHGWIVGIAWRPGTPSGGAALLLKPR